MTEDSTILIAGALMATALIASLVASRVRLPFLVLFLALGMAVGSDGLGWLAFDDYALARDIGIVALILIVMEGGLASGIHRLRPVLPIAVSLATLATLATAMVTGFAASLLFGFSLLESMLLGSIVASTDAAAIFGVLKGSSLRRRVSQTLEGEAGMNDPVAILLVVGFIEWIQEPSQGALPMAVALIVSLFVGLFVGAALGLVTVRGFQGLQLATPGLYPVASVSAAAIAYGAAEAVGGSGLLSVYLVGLALGSADLPAKRTVVAFHEGMGWIAQVVMFLTLGLLVFPSQLPAVAIEGTALGLVLAFVARPIAVWIATAPFRLDFAERVVISWAGLRGAVPVVLATFAVLAGIDHSLEFFDIVFFSVLISTLLQGWTFEWVAERLGVTSTEPALPPRLLEAGEIRRLGANVVEHEVRQGDAIVGLRIRELGLPRDALVSVVVRGDRALPPRGSTMIEAGDRLLILVRGEQAAEVDEQVGRWRRGPVGRRARGTRTYRSGRPIFVVQPWRANYGDAESPGEVLGESVVELLRARQDAPGALVVLEDGRYAITGDALICGSARQLSRYLRGRLRTAADDAVRAWWEQVIGALEVERTAGAAEAATRTALRPER